MIHLALARYPSQSARCAANLVETTELPQGCPSAAIRYSIIVLPSWSTPIGCQLPGDASGSAGDFLIPRPRPQRHRPLHAAPAPFPMCRLRAFRPALPATSNFPDHPRRVPQLRVGAVFCGILRVDNSRGRTMLTFGDPPARCTWRRSPAPQRSFHIVAFGAGFQSKRSAQPRSAPQIRVGAGFCGVLRVLRVLRS